MMTPQDVNDLASMIWSKELRLAQSVRDGATVWTLLSYTDYYDALYPVYGIEMGCDGSYWR
jgi:hypothetical protein